MNDKRSPYDLNRAGFAEYSSDERSSIDAPTPYDLNYAGFSKIRKYKRRD
jgi:hypothetical protein